MDNQISHLSTIPKRKVDEAILEEIKDCKTCNAIGSISCKKCRTFTELFQRYAAANIPISYWKLEMKDFKGDSILLEKYNEIAQNIKKAYKEGVCLCFAGSNGVGKTTAVTNILKRTLEKGYSGLYATLNDIVSSTINNYPDERAAVRKELLTVDFLVIDEFDPRHMGSENAAELFGRILEDIFRSRAQNTLPILMCTNSTNVIESFKGPIKQSISSLMNYVTNVSVLGKDFRITQKK